MRLWRHLFPTSILEATPEQLVRWVFDERALSPESEATEVSHLRQFYAWAHETGWLAVDPAARLRRPRLPMRYPRPMQAYDAATAIETAPDRVRPWLLLAAYAGLRCAEIAQLRADDIWWENRPPLIIIRDSKGGDNSSVPLNQTLASELRACGLPSRGWLFPSGDGRPGPVAAHRVSQLGNRYLHSIGIRATMHQLRHWFGTEMLRAADGNLRVAQEALRHQSIVSTQRYTYVMPTDVAAAVERLPELSTQEGGPLQSCDDG